MKTRLWNLLKGHSKYLRMCLRLAVFSLSMLLVCQSSQLAHSQDVSLESLRSFPYAALSRGKPDLTKSGVSINKPEKAWKGYNLFTNDVDTALLMDMEGKIVRRWKVRRKDPKTRCEYAKIDRYGNVYLLCVGEKVVKLNWFGRRLWQHRRHVHHDIALTDDGSVVFPFSPKSPKYMGRKVNFDSLMFVDRRSGRKRRRWVVFKHLSEIQAYHAMTPLDSKEGGPPGKQGFDYYHLNTVFIIPENELGKSDPRFQAGNILLCLRNTSTLIILDKDSLKIVWGWGKGNTLDFPHTPQILKNGHLLVFDNGYHRGYSRILEIDPRTNGIVWSYNNKGDKDFFTQERGSVQRLENGNTLIIESEKGRVFEVTPEGEVVWEYWSDIVAAKSGEVEVESGDNKGRRIIYRMERLDPSFVESLLARKKKPSGSRKLRRRNKRSGAREGKEGQK